MTNARPTALERYLAGEKDALPEILAGVAAPIFDLALHLFGDEARAGAAAAGALSGLADDLRSQRKPDASPLAAAARHLPREHVVPPPADDVEGVAWDDPGALARITHAASRLNPEDWRLAATAFALDLEDEEWTTALDLDAADGRARAASLLSGLGLLPDDFRDFLDARAARVPMPPGLVDRALRPRPA